MLNSKVSIVERNFLDIKPPSIQCRLDYDRWKRYISQEFRYIEIQPIRFGGLSARHNSRVGYGDDTTFQRLFSSFYTDLHSIFVSSRYISLLR